MRDRVIEITDKDQERDEAELRRVNPKAFQTREEKRQQIIDNRPPLLKHKLSDKEKADYIKKWLPKK